MRTPPTFSGQTSLTVDRHGTWGYAPHSVDNISERVQSPSRRAQLVVEPNLKSDFKSAAAEKSHQPDSPSDEIKYAQDASPRGEPKCNSKSSQSKIQHSSADSLKGDTHPHVYDINDSGGSGHGNRGE